MNATTQKGFTLIELMIVIAIIGILAAIALPAYQDYTNRAKVTEVITYMSSAKTGVAEQYATTTNLTGIDNEKAGLDKTAANNTSTYVKDITITDGKIVATVKGLNNACDDKTITLTPTPNTTTKNLEWAGSSATECTKYVPANFRNTGT
ncbi:pilin [Psychrobacter immobilis]|uniref:pilin n=1 Tax=Psychrobacter immobilis TaxID=498 RepID=UPI00191965FB|nr:pilin [Psychrobacter immobilis]